MKHFNKLTLRLRRTAYRVVFSTREGQTVLRDLAQFCFAHETTFHPDAAVAAALEGRREVWLRIQKHLQLDDEQLWAVQGGMPLQGAEKSKPAEGAG